MLFEHPRHAQIGHLGFCFDTDNWDVNGTLTTSVHLYGPLDVVLAAAYIITALGFPIVDELSPHSCSADYGCMHAGLRLSGHVDYHQIGNALTEVFGPPDITGPAPFMQQLRNAHLN